MTFYCKYCGKQMIYSPHYYSCECIPSMYQLKITHLFFRRFECSDREFFEDMISMFWEEVEKNKEVHKYVMCRKFYDCSVSKFSVEIWKLVLPPIEEPADYTVRNSEQLENILSVIRKIFMMYPDFRFGQMIINSILPLNDDASIYNMENDFLIMKLKEYYKIT